MTEKRLINKLACPFCKGKLIVDSGLHCTRCDLSYPYLHGIPNFLPPELHQKYNSGAKIQDFHEERNFYDRLFSNLNGLDDGHCIVYGYDLLYNFMNDIEGGSLLDIGCGAGHHTKNLSLKGFEVTGVDISINGLLQAKAIAESNNVKPDFVLGDSENLPFADQSYDVVLCSLVLHHFPNRKRILKEIARVSRRYIVAFEVNAYDPISFLRFNIINPTIGISKITRNQRAISPAGLKRSLQELGYEDFKLEYGDVHHYIGRSPNSSIAKILSAYQTAAKFLPAKYICNKFLMKAIKVGLV